MPLIENVGLENLEPANRIEAILNGEDIAPATRLEYFLKQAAAGGGGGEAALVIHVISGPDIPMHLDRTYNEIVTAIENNVPLSIYSVENDVYSFYYPAHVGLMNDSYAVILYSLTNQSVFPFTASTADGQLVIDDEEG